MYCDVYSQEYNARASIYKALACIYSIVNISYVKVNMTCWAAID